MSQQQHAAPPASPTRPPMPPLVYVPTTVEADPAQRRLLMHTVEDGRTALYVYSAIDRLHRFYLADNHWIVLDVAGLQKAFDAAPYDLLLVDVSPGLQEIGEELDR